MWFHAQLLQKNLNGIYETDFHFSMLRQDLNKKSKSEEFHLKKKRNYNIFKIYY